MTIKDVGACEPGSLQFSERYGKTGANLAAIEPQLSCALLDFLDTEDTKDAEGYQRDRGFTEGFTGIQRLEN